jgi:predicted nucleic acid-binding protein
VIADTSPINYLILIGEVAVLPALYGRVIIPPEVLAELTDPGTPFVVGEWAHVLPEWVEVRTSGLPDDEALCHLDPGERAAIFSLSCAPDDAAGRDEAKRRGIPNTGTLGIIRAAGLGKLLDLPSAVQRLASTNFRVSQSLLQELLAEYSRRSQG